MSKTIGQQKEALAADYLAGLGYRVIDRNYRIKQGEVDIICVDKEVLVFVEVKYRASDEYGKAYEYVRPHKIRRIKMAAWHYIQNADRAIPQTYRIDVVAIDGDQISYYQNIPL